MTHSTTTHTAHDFWTRLQTIKVDVALSRQVFLRAIRLESLLTGESINCAQLFCSFGPPVRRSLPKQIWPRDHLVIECKPVHCWLRALLTKRESPMSDEARGALNILHVLRAPVGGLFRHVVDLARGQIARGHRVGMIADSSSGGARADATLAELANELALGLSRVPMSRQIGISDPAAVDPCRASRRRYGRRCHTWPRRQGRRLCAAGTQCPRHPRLHAARRQPALSMGHARGLSLSARRARADADALTCFCSRACTVATPSAPRSGNLPRSSRVVHNGVTRAEFEPIATKPDAADLVFVGELRTLKGVDVLIDAIALAGPRRPARQRHHSRRRSRSGGVRDPGRRARCWRPGAFHRQHPGSRCFRARAAARRAFARGITALYRPRSGGGRHAIDRHRCRGHRRNLRTGCFRTHCAGRSGDAGQRDRQEPAGRPDQPSQCCASAGACAPKGSPPMS